MWIKKLEALKFRAITEIERLDSDNVQIITTPDFGECKAIDMDDAWLIIDKGPVLRGKKYMASGRNDYDEPLDNMDAVRVLEIADKAGTDIRYVIRGIREDGKRVYFCGKYKRKTIAEKKARAFSKIKQIDTGKQAYKSVEVIRWPIEI